MCCIAEASTVCSVGNLGVDDSALSSVQSFDTAGCMTGRTTGLYQCFCHMPCCYISEIAVSDDASTEMCGHRYLSGKILDGDAHNITCPGYDCDKLVPVELIETVVSRDMARRYLQFDIKVNS